MEFFNKIKRCCKSSIVRLFLWFKIKMYLKKYFIPVVNFLVSISSIISVILVFITLKEMQIQRDNTYLPNIIFETKQVDLVWGNQEYIHENPFIISTENVNPTSIEIGSLNIGVGVAQNICFSFSESSFTDLLELLIALDTENKYSYKTSKNSMEIKVNDKTTIYSSSETKKPFLLPNAEEKFSIYIPFHYTKLINRIYEIGNGELIDMPDIQLNIIFNDIQGKQYNELVFLAIKPLYLVSDMNGNGSLSYQIIMK